MLSLIENLAREGVDGVARVGAGDLLLAGNIGAGRVSATEVVHEDGVGPVGLDGGIAVVRTLQRTDSVNLHKLSNISKKVVPNSTRLGAGDGAVHASRHVRDLVVRHPGLRDFSRVDVGSACTKNH